MLQVRNLRSKPLTIKELDDKVVCMTMFCALPAEYSSFASFLQLLDHMTKEKLQAAFVNEGTAQERLWYNFCTL